MVVNGTNIVDTFDGVFNFDNFGFDGELTKISANLNTKRSTLSYQFVGDMDITTAASHGLLHSMITFTMRSSPVFRNAANPSAGNSYNVSFDVTVNGFGYASLQGENVIIQNGSISLHGTSIIDEATQTALLKSPKDTALALKSGQRFASVIHSATLKLQSLIP